MSHVQRQAQGGQVVVVARQDGLRQWQELLLFQIGMGLVALDHVTQGRDLGVCGRIRGC